MLDRKLKEALELLGGKAILNEDGELYVILTMREFRKMKQAGLEGLTKQELVDKINNDIAIWKVAREQDEAAINFEELENESEGISYEKPME